MWPGGSDAGNADFPCARARNLRLIYRWRGRAVFFFGTEIKEDKKGKQKNEGAEHVVGLLELRWLRRVFIV